jgi:hypothetical protein
MRKGSCGNDEFPGMLNMDTFTIMLKFLGVEWHTSTQGEMA